MRDLPQAARPFTPPLPWAMQGLSQTDAVPIRARRGDRPSRTDIGSGPTEFYLPKQAVGQIWLVAHSVLTLSLFLFGSVIIFPD